MFFDDMPSGDPGGKFDIALWIIVLAAIFLFMASCAARACDDHGWFLRVGAGYDFHQTFTKTMSDFAIGYEGRYYDVLGFKVSPYLDVIGHHSTYQTGWPFNDQKDKNVSDYVMGGFKVKIK